MAVQRACTYLRHAAAHSRLVSVQLRMFSSLPPGGANSRNIAIIAHVDHGKTTLVDCLLQQSGFLNRSSDNVRVMDSNDLEKERGITILAKCTSVEHNGCRINIVDTPGHADFGGEVERALTMVDGVVLVVDASEGPMAQTRFVLGKALQRDLVPIVVQNKVDRESARCDEVDCELLDLFITLNANEKQLDYPTIYASAREGWAFPYNPFAKAALSNPTEKQRPNIQGTMSPLFDLIMSRIPPPRIKPVSSPFSLLVNSVELNAFVGKCVLGKVQSGTVRIGDRIKAIDPEGSVSEEGRVTRMFLQSGICQNDITEACAGDIVSIAGLQRASVNYTIASPEVLQPLEIIPVDPPTVSMTFLINSSPIAGSEGKVLTTLMLDQRLRRECDNNISLRLTKSDERDAFDVAGRGELQLGVLIETMRREGHEFAVSPPRVLLKRDESTGVQLEPIEELTIDCNVEFSGGVIEKLARRKAELVRMAESTAGKCRMVFTCPTRGLIGFAPELKNDTKGTGVMSHVFMHYAPMRGLVEFSRKGCMTSMTLGESTAFALSELESRGTLFISPGTRVYPGMVIGECTRIHDLEVNPCRTKAVTNVRQVVRDDFVRLTPPRSMKIEELIAYMSEDEMLEVTPKSVRLRKWDLDPGARKRRLQARRALIATNTH